MSNIEEKAEAYQLAAEQGRAEYPDLPFWSDKDIREAYAAGYAAAERYRLILQAAIRNATPQPLLAPEDDH